MKRFLSTTLSVVLLASLLASCGGVSTNNGDTTKPSTEGTTTDQVSENSGATTDLTFYIWSDEENYIKKVVDQYNTTQDTTNINLISVPESDYDDKLKVLISGGADIDIADIRGMAQVTTYASTSSLLDITDYIEQSDLDVSSYGAMWNTSSNDGRYYALPTRTTCWALFYNKDIFDTLGLEYPIDITWDEYKALSLDITEKMVDTPAEDGSKVYGGYWVPWIYHFEAIQQGVYCTSDDTTALQQSLEDVNDFWSNGSHLSFPEVNSGDYDYIVEFENGHAAMLPNGEWCVNMLLQDAEAGNTSVNWEVAPMPIPTGVESGTTWGQFQFAAITSFCKSPDEAFDFLSYLCGPEGSEIYSSAGMIHAYSSEESTDVYKQTTGKDSVSVLFEAKKVQEQPNDAKYEESLNIFKENAELYFLGEKTIEETMQNFEAQRAKALSK